ncbi:hypothetical protein THIOM_001532 [Candidatus Thiomargarita nelsonii]|uniref:Uncharacterized protein n=1 Tax=Candidatus Thiomargarita nelsonii TaxID=1003181 RepID=A0A0A6RJM8_9GAMM|nr:hypothetical protein THIOM_001532 [Candidatus Thiomargarita nelsonii]
MSDKLSVLTEALQKSSPIEKLEQIVKDLLGKGYSKENILAEFEYFRETTTDEDYEDVVLEVMDFITGWCSPHKRLDTAYTFTETNDNELSYFIIHQLEVIEKAIEQFHHYLEQKHFNLQEAEQLLGNTRIVGKLNQRQLALLEQVLKNSQMMKSF